MSSLPITLPPTASELDRCFPIRAVLKDGREGFAIHAYNSYSNAWQPVGTWFANKRDAEIERTEAFDPAERALS